MSGGLAIFGISVLCFFMIAPFVPLITTEFYYGLTHRGDACNSAWGIGPSNWLIVDASVNCVTAAVLIVVAVVMIVAFVGGGSFRETFGVACGGCGMCILTLVIMFKYAWAIYGAVMLANTTSACRDVAASNDLWSMLLAADVLAFLVVW